MFCGSWGIVLGVAVWFGFLFLMFWWWEKTPLVAIALLLAILIFVFWVVLMLAYFGRWGRRAVVMINAPPWFWWFWFLLAVVLFGLGIVALVDGSESRAGAVLGLMAVVFGIGAWVRMLPIVYRMLPLAVMIPIAAVIVAGAVLGVLGLIAGDELFGPIAALAATLWLGAMVLGPWVMLWRRGVRHQRMPTGLPLLTLIAPLAILVIGTLMLILNGYTRDGPGDSGPDLVVGSETTTTTTTTTRGTVAQDNNETDDSGTPDAQEQEPETFRLPLSDGRSLPIYELDSGTELALGIILPKPAADRCWILQYDGGIADSVGDCRPRFLNDLEPVPASTLFESADSVIVLLQAETDISVVEVAEILVAQGFSSELDREYFRAVDASSATVVIEGVEFFGG